MPGGFLSVSSSGGDAATGIVWASHPWKDDANQSVVDGVLRAYLATNLTQELWNSKMEALNDVGLFAKFAPPTIANGKVYVATFSNQLVVYGITPPVLEVNGRLSFLRVHDVGTGFGPPDDQLDAEVVVAIDTEPGRFFGFQLRTDNNEAARKGMLDTLRTAFNRGRPVRLDYRRTGLDNGILIRVADLP